MSLLSSIFLTDVLDLILKKSEKQNLLVRSYQSSEQEKWLMVKRNKVRAGGFILSNSKKWSAKENCFSFYRI